MTRDNPPRGISTSYLRNLIVKCSLIFIAGILLTTVIFFFSVHQQPGASYQESFRILSQLKQEILAKSVIIYTFAIGLILGGIVFITLLYSHRVVGPMRRIGSFVENISAGDFSGKITLRENDAIQPLADELNYFITEYRETLAKLTTEVEELKEKSLKTGTLESGEGVDSYSEVVDKVKELKVIVEYLKL